MDYYAIARAAIRAGKFEVDPERGLITGPSGRVLACTTSSGYATMRVTGEDGITGMVYQHRVIWEYVHGPIGKGLQIDHKNEVKHDNRIVNLEPVTNSENHLRARSGGSKRGKLTLDQVREIKHLVRTGTSQAEVAKRFEVTPTHISMIMTGRRHASVEPSQGRVIRIPARRESTRREAA